ncbi:MAG TPA: hypothetical protein DHU96_03160 [Actinobacteria bacterium]|nr:hypothetical protein [Actinomycetota bacterium]
MDEITSRFVVPFYLHVLHGNVVYLRRRCERVKVLKQMRAVAGLVTFENAPHLWPIGWQESLMARLPRPEL